MWDGRGIVGAGVALVCCSVLYNAFVRAATGKRCTTVSSLLGMRWNARFMNGSIYSKVRPSGWQLGCRSLSFGWFIIGLLSINVCSIVFVDSRERGFGYCVATRHCGMLQPDVSGKRLEVFLATGFVEASGVVL